MGIADDTVIFAQLHGGDRLLSPPPAIAEGDGDDLGWHGQAPFPAGS